MSDLPDAPENDVEMGFFEHLGELRSRLVKSILGMIVPMGVAWYFKEWLLDWLLAPLVTAWHQLGLEEPRVHFANPIDPFLAYMKIAIVAGILGAAPWIFYQLWSFIAPGLYKREKVMAIPFVLGSTICFAGGAIFGYAVVFPMGFETLLSFAEQLPSGTIEITPTIMINEYLSFATRMLLAFGVVFEIPVVVITLATLGVVDWRGLLKFGRWWVIIATVVAALLTPPDVASQLLMLIPLVGLYFLSVLFVAIIGFRRKKKEPKPD